MKKPIAKILILSFLFQVTLPAAYAQSTVVGATGGLNGLGTTTNINSGFSGLSNKPYSFGGVGNGLGGNQYDFGFNPDLGYNYTPGSFLENEYRGQYSHIGLSTDNPTSSWLLDKPSGSGEINYNRPDFTSHLAGLDLSGSSAFDPDNNSTEREIFMRNIGQADNKIYTTPVFDSADYELTTAEVFGFNERPNFFRNNLEFGMEKFKIEKRRACRDYYVDILTLDQAENEAVTCSGMSVRGTMMDIEDKLRQISYYEHLISGLSEASEDGEITFDAVSTTVERLRRSREQSGYIDYEAKKEGSTNKYGLELSFLEEIGISPTPNSEQFETLKLYAKNDFRAIRAKIEVLKAQIAQNEKHIREYAESPVHKDYSAIKKFLVKQFEARGCTEEFSTGRMNDSLRISALQGSICQRNTTENIYGTELPGLVNEVSNILKKMDEAVAENNEEAIAAVEEAQDPNDVFAALDDNDFKEHMRACEGITTISPYIIYHCEKLYRDNSLLNKNNRKSFYDDEFFESKQYEALTCDGKELHMYDHEVDGVQVIANNSKYEVRVDQQKKIFKKFDEITAELTPEEIKAIALNDAHLSHLALEDDGRDSNFEDGGDQKEDEELEDEKHVVENKNENDDEDVLTPNNDNRDPIDIDRLTSTFGHMRSIAGDETCSANEDQVTMEGQKVCLVKCSSFESRSGVENAFKCVSNRVSMDKYDQKVNDDHKARVRSAKIGGAALGVMGVGGIFLLAKKTSDNGRQKGRNQMAGMLNQGAYTSQFGYGQSTSTTYGPRTSIGGRYSPFSLYGGQTYSSGLSSGLFNFNNTGALFDPTNPILGGGYSVPGSSLPYSGFGNYTSFP
jgi:hypothetical protein